MIFKLFSYLLPIWCFWFRNGILLPKLFLLQCVIINKSDNQKTVRSKVEDSAVDYWAVHVGGTKNNNKHFILNDE